MAAGNYNNVDSFFLFVSSSRAMGSSSSLKWWWSFISWLLFIQHKRLAGCTAVILTRSPHRPYFPASFFCSTITILSVFFFVEELLHDKDGDVITWNPRKANSGRFPWKMSSTPISDFRAPHTFRFRPLPLLFATPIFLAVRWIVLLETYPSQSLLYIRSTVRIVCRVGIQQSSREGGGCSSTSWDDPIRWNACFLPIHPEKDSNAFALLKKEPK